jgi:hypothetical protein
MHLPAALTADCHQLTGCSCCHPLAQALLTGVCRGLIILSSHCCWCDMSQQAQEAAVQQRQQEADARTAELDALAVALAERDQAVVRGEAELEAARA